MISVIVPCYNQSSYLNECLESVLDQTYKDWECIIVDDGSPDNTEDIALEWVKKDERFKYYKKNNNGVSSARNFGIEKASGKWILPLDGDDKIANEYLELAANEFENFDIIYCIGNYFGNKSGEIILDDFEIPKILLENQLFCTAFFKKQDWIKVGGFDESMHKGYEDWEFWLHLISLKKDSIRVKKIDYLGFFYRIKNISRNTQAMNENDTEIRMYIFSKHLNLYQENIKEFSKLLYENRKLKSQIYHLKRVLNSKRYQFINKIFNIFKI